MKKLIDIFIFLGGVVTTPFWVFCLILILLNPTPKRESYQGEQNE